MVRRLLPLILLIAALAPGTWLRSPVSNGYSEPIVLREVAEPGSPPGPGWAVEGIWEYESAGLMFGGFSALIVHGDNSFRAFSDRGARFTFVAPDSPQDSLRAGPDARPARPLAVQPVDERFAKDLWDIESATLDPATGRYWLGYEINHGFHRFTAANTPDGVQIIDEEVDWPANSGAEAMVRLADGRFLVIPERGSEALVYPTDPITGVQPATVSYVAPEGDFAVTDAAQLPDGRIMLLLRRVSWGMPVFEARIAIAALPHAAQPQPISPAIVLDLTAMIPRENYEGLALRPRSDGEIDVWVISDDNLSVMQRTLLAKLRFDPVAAAQPEPAASPQPKQRAPEQ